MLSATEIICVQFPSLIRIELKERYPSWYKHCLFTENAKYIIKKSSLLILPANCLFDSKEKNSFIRIIAFGSADLLEGSFLAGADDFLKEPWSCSELIIRSSKFLNDSVINLGNDRILCKKNTFYINDKLVRFSPLQNRILKILFDNPNDCLSYKDLREKLPPGLLSSENSLYVHIHRIRRLLRENLGISYGKLLTLENSNRSGYILKLPVDNLCKNVDKA